MEIERKFLIKDLNALPFHPEDYPHRELEQGYLCTEPVVRIRKDADQYFLTYKSKGLMIREEYNLPLTEDGYLHLKEKIDGRLITKTRSTEILRLWYWQKLNSQMKHLPLPTARLNGWMRRLPTHPDTTTVL